MSRFQSLANSIPPMNASFSLSVIFPLHNIFILHFLQSDKSFFELKVITIHAHIEYFLIVDNVCLDELCLCCRPALIDEHSLDCLFYHFAVCPFLLCRWRRVFNHFLIRIVNRSCNEFFPTLTFEDVYERWSDEHFPTVSDSNVKGYRAAWALCDKLARMRFVDVKLDHLQMVVDESGKNYPTLRKLKILFGLMYKYAVIHEIIPKERNLVEYLDIKKAGNPNAYNREPFSKTEVAKLWDVKDSNIYYTVILMLIYTGCRIGELLDLKKENVNLEERYFKIVASKTAAGIRTAPISEKVYPFFEYWYNLNDCEYLLSTPEGEHFKYRNYYDSYWSPLIETLGMKHRPHDTRHTCISMLTVAGVSDKVIKKIVGHKGQGVTEVVYTHFEIEELIDTINKI